MNHWHSQRFLSEGQERGIPGEVLQNAIDTAKALKSVSPALPPLFTLGHLAHEADVPHSYLRAIVSRSPLIVPYRVFKLKKRSVGHGRRFRYICVPQPLLLRVQRWVHRQILRHTHPHEASSAYHPGAQIAASASVHCRCRWLLKLDITNFFESILEPSVYAVFRGLGYQPLMAFELARICTRLRVTGNPTRQIEYEEYVIKSYSESGIGHLPQGAPTSPLLANLAARQLDDDLATLGSSFGLRYTRYADDLAFSTRSMEFSRTEAHDFIDQCYAILERNGFWPNRAKTNVVPPRARKVVLGMLVDGLVPRLPRAFKDSLRMHIHFLTHPNIGPVTHAKHRGFDSVLGMQHYLFGLAAFAIGIEPDWGRQRMSELKGVHWPTAAEFFP